MPPHKPPLLILRVAPITYLCVVVIMVIITLIFLYKNFYLTIAQVETVAQLERTVARERLNMNLWDTLLEERLLKLTIHDKVNESESRDPFIPL
ncbi:hypothetical protein A3I42_03550 [Candidatus Uhrbacteria bacterium RIFCSPLOWO2_02_FULL_49_11]|uniref:Uncharacterized protein n=1 Tax=Candidatus Uhrbacteria bacterium RIFCSPLOWO2_02_FULL_49_11 TaxID=1802409 RepID=A0A1F7VBG3_9BACT|nr:MAG: hypothetical protein A3I42_03550 [Candidatus Uhrbacteria bacterium RIFCSPLOWO2_02_FULL_49_11]